MPSTLSSSRPTQVQRWPTERPLFLLVLLVSLLVWLALAISIVGLVYGLFFSVFFFMSHLAFVAHVRGSAVRLGPAQFPEIHSRVQELSRAMEMETPETYIMQAGGALNAFATKFLRRNMVILFSDLLEACGEDLGARDMIIAHELAHIRCGHLRWMWLIAPGYFVPLLGSALSRAREYTCDRYGLVGAENPDSAVRGLAVLAAGPTYSRTMNPAAFVKQRSDVNTGFMTLGEWFSTHPPLSKRVAALDPRLADPSFSPWKGRLLATGIVGAFLMVGVGGTVGAALYAPSLMESMNTAAETAPTDIVDLEAAAAQATSDLDELSEFLATNWTADAPASGIVDVEALWLEVYPDHPFPMDPFDGLYYGYAEVGGSFELWSSGPDGVGSTADDMVRVGEFPAG